MSQHDRDPWPPFDHARFLLKLVAGVIISRLVMITITGSVCLWWYRLHPPTLDEPISPVCESASERADHVMSSTLEIALALMGGGSVALIARRRPPDEPPK
jgi:hypothetical protein